MASATIIKRLSSSPSRIAATAKKSAVQGYGTARGRIARMRARRRPTTPGITVVSVNWNSLPFLEVLLSTVAARSPKGTQIIVVDNGSTDGSREYLRSRPDIESVLLRVNVRHGRALDVGVARVRTDTVVVLDIDAFPTTDDWLTESLAALRDGKLLSGAYVHRNYIHPCFMVADTNTLIMNDLSFKPVGVTWSGERFGLFLDVGEAISQAVIAKHGGNAVLRIPATEATGPGLMGTVFGGVVYHNFQSTYGTHRDTALQRFEEAVQRFGGSGTVGEQA